jgi:dihydropteroate synthase
MAPHPLQRVPGLPVRDRALVMGILNVTPDSFSDGGTFFQSADAIARGIALQCEGADIIDVGGESTRPGAHRVPEQTEADRVLPVIRELTAAGAFVSIDTTRASVAAAALNAGAGMINDVSGGLGDPEMARCAADAGVPYIAMHWRAPSDVMACHTQYDNVVDEVGAELAARLEALIVAGVPKELIILDPGLGFAKQAHHDWQLLRGLPQLSHELDRPLLVGASRKSFLVAALATEKGIPRPKERDDATTAVSALAAVAGAYCLRVHRVGPTLDALRVAAAWQRDEDRGSTTAGGTQRPDISGSA